MISYYFLHIFSLLSLFVPKFDNFFLFLISCEDWPGKYCFHKVWDRCWLQVESKGFSSFRWSGVWTAWYDGWLRRSLYGLFLGLAVIVWRLLRLYFLCRHSFRDFACTLLITDLSWSTHITQLCFNFLPHGLGSVTACIRIEPLNIV
jgi:hypothetical protein